MNKIRRILLYSITLITILVGLILYQIKTYDPPPFNCRIPTFIAIFGTPNLTEDGREGKEIFDANCAACHKKYAKTTGPALYETDSLVFVKWLTNKKNKIGSTKIEEFGIDYHRMTFSKTLNKEEIACLIEYCNN